MGCRAPCRSTPSAAISASCAPKRSSQTIEAHRLVSLGALGLVAQARTATTVEAVRGIVGRIVSGLQIAAGGIGAVAIIGEVQNGIMQAQTIAEAKRFIDRVDSMFQWQCRMIPGTRPGEISVEVSAAGTGKVGNVDARKYLRRMRARGPETVTVAIYIDPVTRLPIREETLDAQGRAQWVMEYFDVSAPISFDVPDCVK